MPMLRPITLCLATLALVPAVSQAHAQLLPDTGTAAVRDAQRRFERYRREHLPVAYAGGGECDVRIGRYCYWNSDLDDPPREPETIARERRKLLETLRAHAAARPADGWTAAQLVRYLVEDGRTDDAVQAARACGEAVADDADDADDAWWCAALRGYALHRAGDDSAAAGAFDSALAAMRDAQRRFELYRREHLPVADAGGGPCEVQVGRYCYWNSDFEPPPPPEPEGIGRERRRLIETLRARAAEQPNDGWVAGQLVRYLVEEGRADEALAAARDCGATTGVEVNAAWWCTALRGYAYHRAGDDSAATTAFDSALAAMPDSTRCRWTDVSLWLEGDAAKHYESLGCAERERLARRTWWLARPLLVARAGDEARAEFLSRRTLAAIYAGSAMPQVERWGADVEEVGLRYGWPTAWERREQTFGVGATAPPSVIGYEPRPARAFASTDPTDSTGGRWSLDARYARSRFAPSYADSIVPLGHQLARFRRGDSTIVVAAFDGGARDAWGSGPLRAGLALAAGPDSLLAAHLRDADAPRGTLTVTAAPRASALVAVELWSPAARRAARARYAVPPLDSGAAISDILLVNAAGYETDAANGDLAKVLPDAMGETSIRAGDRVALYWESYVAPREDAPITVSLTVYPRTMSVARKFAVALGLADRPAPTTLRWDDSGRPDGPLGHVLVLRTDGMPEGKYRLELSLKRDGKELGVAKRDLELR